MIDLTNKYVLVRTQEEYEKILKEAEKHGFRWSGLEKMNPLPNQRFPDILEFDKDYTAYRYVYPKGELIEASELLGTKEMTAREFIESISKTYDCSKRSCKNCALYKENTKCGKSLCDGSQWANDIDEIISIAKSGRIEIKSKEEEAVEAIQNFIDNPDTEVTDDFIERLRFVVDKLKEQTK